MDADRDQRDPRVARLRAHLESASAPARAPRPGDVVRRRLPNAVPRVREGLAFAMRPVATRRLAALEGRPLRVHVGSGFEYKEGWVNIDLPPVRVDVPWNLKRGLPFADGTADAVFSEHVWEHIPMAGGLKLLEECARVVRPGGVVRIGVPDAGALLRSYAGQISSDWADSQATPMISVQMLFYDHGHAAMYDEDTLSLLFRAAGLSDPVRREAGESAIVPCPDSPSRASGTLYVEAVKA